mgnify:CR=1 FL=1
MLNIRKKSCILTLLFYAGITQACILVACKEANATSGSVSNPVLAPYSYEQIRKRDYQGQTLRILVHEKPNMGEPVELHANQFSQLTGAKVELTFVPFGDLYPRLLWGLRNHWYDVVFYGSLWLPDTFEYLHPMLDSMKASHQFQDIIPYHKSIATWNDTIYQVPIDGDRHYFQYRTDAFTDIKLQRLYFQKYQKPLVPPKTWQEVNQQAEFFHGRAIGENQAINGLVEITKMQDLMFSNFIKRAAPYAKHPEVKGGFFFELSTMKPLINTPGFVEALEDFVTAHNYYPKGGKQFGLADVNQSFASGEAVFCDSWDDSFIFAMQKDSPTFNKVSAAISPGSHKVWNRVKGQWDHFPEVNYAPYIAWGWTSAVTANANNPDMAFDFLGFFSNQKNHYSDLLIGRFGVNPYRMLDIDESFWRDQAGWDPVIAKAYIQSFVDQSASKNRVYDLRIHKSGLYMKALSIGITRATTGRSSPQEALDDVARKWWELNREIGIDKQRRAYANVVKLEDSRE